MAGGWGAAKNRSVYAKIRMADTYRVYMGYTICVQKASKRKSQINRCRPINK